MPTRTLIDCIFFDYSAIGEMSHFFADSDDMPTSSALCQRCKLLDPDIFKRIHSLFVNSFDNHMTINGYHILAQDGSDVNIPFMDDEIKAENVDSKSFCQYHINALYDCLNNIFYDWSMTPIQKSKKQIFLYQLSRIGIFRKSLYLLQIEDMKMTTFLHILL